MGFLSDFADVLDAVADFLGVGAEGAADALDAMAGAKEIAQTALDVFDQSLGMCVNEGQLVLMNNIGADQFAVAGLEAYENQEDVNLVDLTDHPEAIGEILEQAQEQLNDVVQSLLEAENGLTEDSDD